jgi:hypothetical protein
MSIAAYLESPLTALKDLHPHRLESISQATQMIAMLILHNRPQLALTLVAELKQQLREAENDASFLELEAVAKMAMVSRGGEVEEKYMLGTLLN